MGNENSTAPTNCDICTFYGPIWDLIEVKTRRWLLTQKILQISDSTHEHHKYALVIPDFWTPNIKQWLITLMTPQCLTTQPCFMGKTAYKRRGRIDNIITELPIPTSFPESIDG
jgi:hypothetical protein